MADAAQYIGKRVENEYGMVGVIRAVSNRCAYVDFDQYRPDDEPTAYLLVIPLTDLEPASPTLPES